MQLCARAPSAYLLDSGGCLPADFLARNGDRAAAPNAWQVRTWLQGSAAVGQTPHLQATGPLPSLHLPYGIASSQLADLGSTHSTSLSVEHDVAWALRTALSGSTLEQPATRPGPPSSACKHDPEHPPYSALAATLIRRWRHSLSAVQAEPVQAILQAPQDARFSLTPEQPATLREAVGCALAIS